MTKPDPTPCRLSVEEREYAKQLSKRVYGTTSRWQKVMRKRCINEITMVEVMELMKEEIDKAMAEANGGKDEQTQGG